MTMKPKQDKPLKYLVERYNKHIDTLFSLLKSMPFGTNVRIYNAYRQARQEYYKLKKYKENGK